ncbi:MAG: hypothetical protein LBE61_20480 [Burkholderiaceae bacterium]|jgi:hypothetical protein|nr:hypothetical protein [Burkholderiaceae bacterium]
MKIQYQLIDYLKSLLKKENVSTHWVGNTLHLVDPEMQGGTVFIFPQSYWGQFEGATSDTREQIFHSICMYMREAYRASTKSYTRFIEIPCLEGCEWKISKLCTCCVVCAVETGTASS